MEKRTPLYDRHLALGAKMVPFAGFSMPVQYAGIRQEHQAVRSAAGLFDVSHMGNVFVTGRDALAFLQSVTVNDVAKLADSGVQYSALAAPDGSAIDDILVYRLGEGRYRLVVNASNVAKDLAWLADHRPAGAEVEIRDASGELGIIALQGPRAAAILAKVADGEPGKVKYYGAGRARIAGVDTAFSRTGYTGEDGFEIFPEHRHAPALWDALLEAGAAEGLQPIGLGARDTLRLEAGYSLYGHELGPDIDLLAAGLGWIVAFGKGDFIGREALERIRAAGPRRKLVGLEMLDRAIPREGYRVERQGRDTGYITSGTASPTLDKGIALALVGREDAASGSELDVVIRDQRKPARVVGRNFYRRPKA